VSTAPYLSKKYARNIAKIAGTYKRKSGSVRKRGSVFGDDIEKAEDLRRGFSVDAQISQLLSFLTQSHTMLEDDKNVDSGKFAGEKEGNVILSRLLKMMVLELKLFRAPAISDLSGKGL
jgi:hypothetical protein